jgi:hypothetical protein
MRLLFALALCGGIVEASRAETVFDLRTASLTLQADGRWGDLVFADGTRWPTASEEAFGLETAQGRIPVEKAVREGDRLLVSFADGTAAEFVVRCAEGFALLQLTHFEPKSDIRRFRVGRLPVPAASEVAGMLNAAYSGTAAAALLGAEINLHAFTESSGGSRADRAGCQHEFVPTTEARVGKQAVRFTARSDPQPGGWSMRGRNFARPLDLTGCQAIRAWVHGDGKGQALKIQLFDGSGGYRDNYVTIDFQGWRQLTLVDPSFNTLRYERVSALNFYYNSLPPGTEVSCLIDQVEALVRRDGVEQTVLLEDFESPQSPLWSPPVTTLNLQSYAEHGLQPIRFGIVACPRNDLLQTVRRFELAAGLPSPEPGAVWNKQSPWIRRSYFFLTQFSESQFDEALAIARRGGFHTILLDQGSWCAATGHFEVNRDRFPDGLDGLARTVRRFQDAGFRVGFHLLSASIYPPDPYLTPVPDPRLVTRATAALADDVGAQDTFLPATAAPDAFPAEDGGYEGDGSVLRVGNELIRYGRRVLESPAGFADCQRGYLGTQAVPHAQGETIAHLLRSYGYHLYDMDTSLLDEVTTNFARVANACGIEMIYFDGSERLQGDHWYYNARMHQAYYDKLANRNVLLQASSCSHYSWHLLARSASADGHGDLKGYLDERSPGFDYLARNGMPLDIGWYYGYDPQATPDMFEYVLGATIAYDASVSFQVSVDAAARHPFTSEILDLIARYEQLRLSGRVPSAMKARLRIDPALGGKRDDAERQRLAGQRREYRLLGDAAHPVFQRVVYTPWHEVVSPAEDARTWRIRVDQGPAQVGIQLHPQPGPWLAAPAVYSSPEALLLEAFDNLAPYKSSTPADQYVDRLGPGEAGSVLPGVSQEIRLAEDDVRSGTRYAIYTANSTLSQGVGWSVFGRSFSSPLDLSWHQGIGFWLRGDGQGGQFKLQLCDDRGAMDYYIANDYSGWRFQQLVRPQKDTIDYRRVQRLLFYYNGLPGRTQVSCGIDDVKALRKLEERRVTDPFVEIDGQRLAMQGSLREGQYVLAWPGETARRYAPLQNNAETDVTVSSLVLALTEGEHTVRFGCKGDLLMPVRVRVTLQPGERYEIP